MAKCTACKKEKKQMIDITFSTIGIKGKVCMDCLVNAMPPGRYGNDSGEGDR